MTSLKRILEYFSVGHLRLVFLIPLIILLIGCYFGKMEVQIQDWKNLLQLFVTISGVLLAFVFHGNISLGIEFNRFIGYRKSEFLRDYWNSMKRSLLLMFTSFATLLSALIYLTLFGYYSPIISDDWGFLSSLIAFTLFVDAFGNTLVNQYMSFEGLRKVFSPDVPTEITKIINKELNKEKEKKVITQDEKKQYFLNLHYATLGLLMGLSGNIWVYYFSKWFENHFPSIDWDLAFYCSTIVFVLWLTFWLRYILRGLKLHPRKEEEK